MCHVFRCDTPARTIANTLRDICRRLMLERRPNSLGSLNYGEKRLIASQFNLFVHVSIKKENINIAFDYFAEGTYLPSPIEEPKKIIQCNFLGVTQVPRATGIGVLNEAVDRLVSQVSKISFFTMISSEIIKVFQLNFSH